MQKVNKLVNRFHHIIVLRSLYFKEKVEKIELQTLKTKIFSVL